jgi:hypothetical protein
MKILKVILIVILLIIFIPCFILALPAIGIGAAIVGISGVSKNQVLNAK